MARVHKSYRLDEETVARVTSWAEERGVTITQAMEQLLAAGLDAQDGEQEQAQATADAEMRAMLGEHIRDLRATVSTLTAQVSEKDVQIRRLTDLADHAQALQAAQVRGQLMEAAEAVDVAHVGTQDETQRPRWRVKLARWIAGGEV
jgi:hypothetical protein